MKKKTNEATIEQLMLGALNKFNINDRRSCVCAKKRCIISIQGLYWASHSGFKVLKE